LSAVWICCSVIAMGISRSFAVRPRF